MRRSTQLVACQIVIFQALMAAAQPDQKAQQSGYNGSDNFGGPSGVSTELQVLDEERDSLYHREWHELAFGPWFSWKERFNDDYGLKLGVNGLFLYQYASEDSEESSDREAAGGIYRVQGNWTGYARENGNSGRIEWRIEARSGIGGDPSPQQLGGQYTAALNSGFPYGNDFDIDLTILAWKQIFADGRAGLTVGRLAFDAYLDSFVTQTPYGGFLNRGFVFSPTLATTGAGALGIVSKAFVTDQLWLGGQIYDGNAVNGEFDRDTFREHEWLKALEIGWTPHIEKRHTQRIQFTYWEKDQRRKAGITAGKGWAVSASADFSEDLLGFVRGGHSDGGAGVAASSSVSLGVKYLHRPNQTFFLGLGWADPSPETYGEGLDDEYVIETSYQLQLTKNLSLTPDIQWIANPAKQPEKDQIWMFGIRGILTL